MSHDVLEQSIIESKNWDQSITIKPGKKNEQKILRAFDLEQTKKSMKDSSHHQSKDQIKKEVMNISSVVISGEEKPSIMQNIPLLLNICRNQIVEDKLIYKDEGVQKWKIGKRIGGGASGSVFKALNIRTGVLSAVKKITFWEGESEETKIHHQNIVRYLEHYNFQDQTWIFMQYVPGTLKNFYKDFGPPPYDTYIHFAKQMITALDYLHRQKIVHKDIKCANILLTSKGVLKLTDYGCSKGFDQTIFLVNYESKGSKTQKGTSHWMAPESIVEGIYTRKTDVWSLGCTLLQLATANIPWAQKNFQEHKIMLYIGQTEDLPLIPESLNQNIRKLIQSCIKRNPDERSSTQELLKMISQFQI